MAILERIEVRNLRRVRSAALALAPRMNLVVGPNAAGKTTLLEALFLLGRGRSFRTTSMGELAGGQERQWRVSARFDSGEMLRVAWDGEGLFLRSLAGWNWADVARRFPIQVVEPGQGRIVEDGPAYRRRFLDWGVFHVEHRFLAAWRAFSRAMRQRNRALRQRRADIARSFEAEMAEAGEAVQSMRSAYVAQLEPLFRRHAARLLHEEAWQLVLHAGWRSGEALADRLDATRARDLERGLTSEGPHRAELRIRTETGAVRRQISRGQQKLLLAALVLAQGQTVHAATGQWPILLVDDFAAELGSDYRQRLAEALADYPGQCVVTALEVPRELARTPRLQMFHVEQGEVTGPAAGMPR